MRQSQLFTKTRREAPTDEVAKNAQLLIRAGFIHKEMAGVYSFLPLGLRVINKIITIIREEMNAIGGQEVFMPTLQDPSVWEKTNRWDDTVVDVWFKARLTAGGEVGFGWTHEEMITHLMTQYIASYKDLPRAIYQIQNKFRNEVRAKSGIMRTREFLMKDLYSFSRTEEEHATFYDACAEAYERIFRRIGIGHHTYKTFASGGAFSKFSHEFQTISDAGEDTIYVNEERHIAINSEVIDQVDLASLGVTREDLTLKKSIEVGNIFSLGTKFSEALNLTFTDEHGNERPVIMGSYGIGPARSMGTVVETHADERGIVWPETIAPFRLHLIGLNLDDPEVRDFTEGVYSSLQRGGAEVLFDDRDMSAGQKFADSDLIGIPHRLIVSRKSTSEGRFEIVERKTGETFFLTEGELYEKFCPEDVE